jgi:hypothetical protein
MVLESPMHNQSLEQTKDACSFDTVWSNPWLLNSNPLGSISPMMGKIK